MNRNLRRVVAVIGVLLLTITGMGNGLLETAKFAVSLLPQGVALGTLVETV